MSLNMRNTGTLLALLTLGLMGCASQKTFEKNPPFTVSDGTVSYWTGGRRESGSGMQVRIRWTPGEDVSATPDSLYFRGRVLPASLEDTETGQFLVAESRTVTGPKPDRVMHSDSLREVGNQPPLPLMDPAAYPFDLKPDEAVLACRRNPGNERFYVKIAGIKEKQARIYPERPRH